MAETHGFSMGTVAGTSIPVEHLDYGYIEKCKNARELEKIVQVLRSGKEGLYPQLVEYAEKRLTELDPDSKTLLRDAPARRSSELGRAERQDVEQDLEGWLAEMKGEGPVPGKGAPMMTDAPPIRASGVKIPPSQGTPAGQGHDGNDQKSHPSRIKSWDKYDAEKAVENVDEADAAANISLQGGGCGPPDGYDLSEWEISLPQSEKEQLAERERIKGNEEFRSGGFEEALRHYKRSVALHPTPAALNNRALTYLKLLQYKEAIADCEQVLVVEPGNSKALYRKATACDHLGDLNLAKECLERALQADDKNQKAQSLLKSVEKKLQSKAGAALPGTAGGGPSKKAKGQGKKIPIVEVLEDPSDSAAQSPTPRDAGKTEGGYEEVGSSDQPSAPPTQVADSGDKLETHWDTMQQQSYGSDKVRSNDSDKQQSSVSDKQQSGDGDKQQSSDSDKQQSGDSGKQQPGDSDKQQSSEAMMQRPPPPDASVLPNHLPSEVHAMKREGNDLFQKGQYAEALDKYSQALQNLEKASPPGGVGGRCMLLNNRAACWLKLGDCNQCVKDCTSSIKLYPVNIKAFARRAQAHELKESFGLAFADYKCAVLLDSLFEQGRKAMARLSQFLREQHGQLWMEQLPKGDIELVLSAVSSGCARDEPPAESLVSFDMLREEGNSLVRSGQFSEALECYSQCIAMRPDNAVGYTNRALCHLKLNQPSLAEQDCSTALVLEPANIKALYRRGLARKELKKFSEAARDLSDLLKRDQSNVVATKELESVKELWRKELKDLQSDVRSSSRTAQPPAGSGKKKKRIVIEEASEEVGADDPAVSVSPPVSAQCEPEGPQRVLEKQVDLEEACYQLSAPIGKVSPFEFLQKWNSVPVRADNAAHCYALLLLQVDPPELPRIISKSLDGAMLSGILKALRQPSVRQDMPRLAQLLQSLTSVDRFSTVVLFLSKQEKEALRELFHEMRECFSDLTTQETPDIKTLEERFGL